MLIRGPTWWITINDLRILKREAGFPMEVANSEFINLAAMARVSWYEGRLEGGLDTGSKDFDMQHAIRESDQEQVLSRRSKWRLWYSTTFVANLSRSLKVLKDKGISPSSVDQCILAGKQGLDNEQKEKLTRKAVQRTVVSMLKDQEHCLFVNKLYKALASWSCQLSSMVLRGWRPTRALNTLEAIRQLVPPRVLAAVLRTWLDGWTTLG